MKRIKLFAATVVMTVLMSMTSFAGQWMHDDTGWWYENSDGTYLKDGWYWINGASYLFDGKGYIYQNMKTPDGYTVNGDGAWCVNGVVQTRAAEVSVAGLTVRMANGYDCEIKDDAVTMEQRDSEAGAMVLGVKEDDLDVIRAVLGEEGLKMISDQVAQELVKEFGSNPSLRSQDVKTFGTGSWYHYLFDVRGEDGSVYDCHFYVSFQGNITRMAAIVGKNSEFDENQFMTNYIR